MRVYFLYTCLVCIYAFAGEHKPVCQNKQQKQCECAIERLQLQIKEAEKDREEAIHCRNDSRDPLDRAFYAQQVTSTYFLIQGLQARLLYLQPKS